MSEPKKIKKRHSKKFDLSDAGVEILGIYDDASPEAAEIRAERIEWMIAKIIIDGVKTKLKTPT